MVPNSLPQFDFRDRQSGSDPLSRRLKQLLLKNLTTPPTKDKTGVGVLAMKWPGQSLLTPSSDLELSLSRLPNSQ